MSDMNTCEFDGCGQTPVTEGDWCVKSTLTVSGEKAPEKCASVFFTTEQQVCPEE